MEKQITLVGGGVGAPPEKKYRTYFMQNEDGDVKIGKTTWPIQIRLRQLQTGSSQKLTLLFVAEGVDREKEWHERFKHLKIKGEWYRGTPALLGFIERLKNPMLPKGTSRWGKASPPRYQNHKGWYWQPKVSGAAT
jgi:hypothetical protein